MRSKWLYGAALLAIVGTAPASAQWTYQFSAPFHINGEQYYDADTDAWHHVYDTQTLAFTLTAAEPITTAQLLTPATCSITPSVMGGSSYACDDQQFDPSGFGTGYSYIGASFISYDQLTGLPNGGGTGFFFFDWGAFTTPGTHHVTSDPLSGPNPDYDPAAVCPPAHEDLCRMLNDYGNAGPGMLIVSFDNGQTPGGPGDVVPEPATMTLLATGLAGMAAARRRRRS